VTKTKKAETFQCERCSERRMDSLVIVRASGVNDYRLKPVAFV